jgi:hypothetical protein
MFCVCVLAWLQFVSGLLNYFLDAGFRLRAANLVT